MYFEFSDVILAVYEEDGGFRYLITDMEDSKNLAGGQIELEETVERLVQFYQLADQGRLGVDTFFLRVGGGYVEASGLYLERDTVQLIYDLDEKDKYFIGSYSFEELPMLPVRLILEILEYLQDLDWVADLRIC